MAQYLCRYLTAPRWRPTGGIRQCLESLNSARGQRSCCEGLARPGQLSLPHPFASSGLFQQLLPRARLKELNAAQESGSPDWPGVTAARQEANAEPAKTEFEGRSTRQRRQRLKTIRRSSIANRIRGTLHAPAPSATEKHERVVDCKRNLSDVPRASAISNRKPREGHHFFGKFTEHSTRQRLYRPKTTRRFAIHVQNSHGTTARTIPHATKAIRHARSPQRVVRLGKKFARRHNGSDPTRIPAEGCPAT